MDEKLSRMSNMANSITILRVIIALIAITIIKINPFWNLIATMLTIIALLLDALDGYMARLLSTQSIKGGIYDILADRIIECLFFIFFASQFLFSPWIAIIMVVRGLLIDAIRSTFTIEHKSAFG